MSEPTADAPAPPATAPPSAPPAYKAPPVTDRRETVDDQVETDIDDGNNAPADIENPERPAERDNLQSVALGNDNTAAADGENPFKTPKPEEDTGADIPARVVGASYGEGASGIPNESEKETYEKNVLGCLVGLIVTSCITVAQASEDCTKRSDPLDDAKCKDEKAFAVAAGVIPLFMTLVMLALLRFMRPMFEKIIWIYSLFMVVWAAVSVAVCTFADPWTDTGNGYFAVWGTAIITVYLAQITVAKFKAILGRAVSSALAGNMQKRVLMVVLLFSIVEAFAAVIKMGDKGTITDGTPPNVTTSEEEKWVFSCAVISAGLIGIYQLFKICKCITLRHVHLKFFSYFLSIWWLFGAGVATFDNPFPRTGNGYFCAWGAYLASCYLAYLCTTATPEMLARQDSNINGAGMSP